MKCEFCGKEYKYIGNLKLHEQVHNGQALTCVHCDMKFVFGGAYKSHLVLNHPNNCKDHMINKYCECITNRLGDN